MTGTHITPGGTPTVHTPKEMAEQAASYYETLMATKVSEKKNREQLLRLLKQNRISKNERTH